MTRSSEKEPPWAELCVLRGAPAQKVAFAAYSPAHHVLGSGEGASLRFLATGIAPHHLDLIWDGENAWLEDRLRLGRTTVNGQTLNEWLLVPHAAIVVLGSVSLGLRCEGVSERRSGPNFDALERARLLQTGAVRRRETLRIGAVKTAAKR